MPKIKTIHGKPVVYPKIGLHLDVKAKHAREGNRKDWASCALARAAMDEPGIIKAAASMSRLYVETDKEVRVYKMNSSGRDQIIGFDRFQDSKKFDVGEYYFPPLQPAKRTGKQQGTDTRPTAPTGKHRKKKRHIKIGVRGRFNPITNW
jgi:hypothetical protein